MPRRPSSSIRVSSARRRSRAAFSSTAATTARTMRDKVRSSNSDFPSTKRTWLTTSSIITSIASSSENGVDDAAYRFADLTAALDLVKPLVGDLDGFDGRGVLARVEGRPSPAQRQTATPAPDE